MCIIADDTGPLCLGGILGGVPSSCTDATVNVFMECASWDPNEIARTGRKTGIVSDARYRLERSVDPALTEPALELATRLVMEICGGTPMEPAISGEDVFPNTVIEFPISEVRRLTGLELPAARISELLSRLGFVITGSGPVIAVRVPSWRPDVTQKADVVEEVMRLEGVDKVPVDPLPRLSGVAPRIAINSGRCFAGNAVFFGCADVTIATRYSNIRQLQITGAGTVLQLCNEVGITSVAACPPISLLTYNVTQGAAPDAWNIVNVADPLDAGVFYMARVAGKNVYLAAGTNTAAPNDSIFRIGLTESATWPTSKTSGGDTNGSWGTLDFDATTYSTVLARSDATVSAFGANLTSPSPTIANLRLFTGPSAENYFATQDGTLSAVVGARGGPVAGYLQIGLAR